MTALLLPLVGAVLLLLAPLGARAGLWSYLVGFLLIAISLVLGAIGGTLALVAAVKTPAPMPIVATVVGLAVVTIPVWMVLSFRGAPPIHDISTDTSNPPAFARLLTMRQGARNPPDYDGPQVAAQQRAAYPDIQPLVVAEPPPRAFERALAAVGRLPWAVVAADGAAGRIEAVDTTLWFGFKDDVVVRVSADGSGSRIDVRSKSRVGVGDGGANARRVRALLDALRDGT